MSVQNLQTFDPFADEGDPLNEGGGSTEVGTSEYIHIRIQQRNGRKTLTTLQGLPKRMSLPATAPLSKTEKMGQVIQLQGDQRTKIFTFLVDNGLEKTTIKVHGF
ncbi:translation initiation factor SUI1 [Ephemerocybe angulata]|uniref:Translation initiation factor SUI1 n=1 Tax=Ephemerocybe angulata TaxID=980116 RepID=A0A8H6IFT0_9AGAR|nr:translation initiation factor SUI1 [Tulosesus angulatus]